MFLLNNLDDREHRKIYPPDDNKSPGVFDLSQKQIDTKINSDCIELRCGSLVCVVTGSYKMSTIFIIDSIDATGKDEGRGEIYVARGKIAAKFHNELSYTKALNKYGVVHPRLPGNKFAIGFNVANLKEQLDEAKVKVGSNLKRLGELKGMIGDMRKRSARL